MLRDYQQSAVDAAWGYLKENPGKNPLIVAPTGAGKSHIIAALAARVLDFSGARVLILQHRKELIEQNAAKVSALLPKGRTFGIYSAGLNARDSRADVVVAGIQSVYSKAAQLGKFALTIIDEAHLMPNDGEGMYRTLLEALQEHNPRMRTLGLTATPFRMKTGALTNEGGLFNDICYNIDIKYLIEQGYLAPIISKAGVTEPDYTQIKIRGGDYVQADADAAWDRNLSIAALKEISRWGNGRKSILVFCSGVRHTEAFTKLIQDAGFSAECITGQSMFRDEIIEKFRSQKIRFLVNCDVLTTGFDAPNVDCVALLRPTQSKGLYVQMVGRGMRISPGKEDCLLLDFGGNVERHGPIDLMEVRKVARKENGEIKIRDEVLEMTGLICPECRGGNHPRSQKCVYCGYVFPLRINHNAEASESEPISKQYEVHEVLRSEYTRHEKNGRASLRIEHVVNMEFSVSEFLCFDHGGFATECARQRWKLQAIDPERVPSTTSEAFMLAEAGALKPVERIKITRQKKFWRVTAWKWGTPQHEREEQEADAIFNEMGINF